MKELLKLGGYLLVVCAVAGVALSGTNHFTFDRIREEKAANERRALKDVLPSASTFRQEKDYKVGLDEKNAAVGYVLNVAAVGYSGKIEAIVGIDGQFNVTGVKVLSQTETPGLGAKIARDAFLDQFKGRAAEAIVLKKDGGQIDAITAATISSRAITKAVKERVNGFKNTYR
jgi:electron transport complex protein RnfG